MSSSMIYQYNINLKCYHILSYFKVYPVTWSTPKISNLVTSKPAKLNIYYKDNLKHVFALNQNYNYKFKI